MKRSPITRKKPIRKFRRDPESAGPVGVMRDGREICRNNRSGRIEYKLRTLAMAMRQANRCCFDGICPHCPGSLFGFRPTFDHEYGRGGGRRDDRITLPDRSWQNGAAHLTCNTWAGSRKFHYNAARNAAMKEKHA